MAAKIEATPVPVFVSAPTIADFTALSTNRVVVLAQEGKIPKPTKKGHYLFRESVRAIVEDARARGVHRPGAEDTRRKVAAEANSAELDAARKAGELMPTEQAERIIADYFIQVRRVIEDAEIPQSQKNRILTSASKIKLEDNLPLQG